MPSPATIELLADRNEISDLLHHYAELCDAQAYGRLGECFTQDATLVWNGEPARNGIAELISFHQSGARSFVAVTHFLGRSTIAVTGDQAEARTCATYIATGPSSLVVRGIRYLDRLRRVDGGWRIHDRLHACDWMYVTTPMQVVPTADRVRRGPTLGGSASSSTPRPDRR